ncbi:SDR family NAD(P)-dependent oxidoreductase [Loktanella sp. S4079]|uniref:SDR family NAD(P)-dependent oxidoreductase n=1 Tax=Loktanella sp. S4079 TaxID=579483 RepID=UPI0005FA03FC|nr:SDR family NAD(P)-dependent oxidoreductase [Loktanella sp. S4079]KJZ18339.1 C factor, cell signaling protein [Loktanella sp. S4079]
MKKALIIGASGGIGNAVQSQLQEQGWHVTGLSRSTNGFDLRQPEQAAKHLKQLRGPFDLVFVATGILAAENGHPEKSLAAISPDEMARVFAVNAIGPAIVLQALPHLLDRQRKAVVGVLSARVGSIGDNQIGGWHSYRASKAALNQLIRGAAIELQRTHPRVACVALHPGTVRTSFTQAYVSRHPTVSAQDAAMNVLKVMNDLSPDQSGQFFDAHGQEVPW